MLAIFGIILFSPQYSFAQYCVSGGPSSTFDSNTESVNLLGDAASAISYTGCPAVLGVEDLTASQSVAVTGGASYTADIQFGTCGGNYGNAGEAWIDWNQNTVFDPSESIGTWSGTPPTTLSSFAFTVPPSALAGATRMRVMQRENGTLPLDPCGTFSYGSVVDFTVNVTPATFCAAGPTSTFDSNTESVNLIGAGGSAISYTGCPGVTGTEDLTASQSVEIYTGNAYTANIQFGTCGGNYGSVGEAWIDWNQNAVFDPSESIGTWSGTPPTTLSSFAFTVPAGAVIGATRMRVMQRESGTLPLDPCGTFAYGSVVDFTVNVSPLPVLCASGGPTSTFDSNTESVNLLGDAASAISYTGCPGVSGVEDLTASQSVAVTGGASYTADIQFGTCGGNYGGAGEAWIDWNQNAVFDPSESIGTWSGSPPATLSSFTFTVPIGATPGATTMRVTQQEGGILPLDPCGAFFYGSVVDFTVNVSPAPTYCTGGPSSIFDSNIESVNLLGDAASAISYSGCPGVTGVEDLTASQSVDVSAGTSYSADIVFGSCGGNYGNAGEAWIDWDKNGVFDPSESIGTWSGTPPAPSSFVFTVPTLGVNGITTMRVMQQEGGSLPLDPCASFSWGSVVDFSVNVSGMSLITCPAPTALTATAITATSADFGWTDNALSGIANIEYGAAGFILGTGTLITGTSNNPETVTGLTPETGYEFYVQSDCGLGDFSTWSGPFSFTTPCEAIIAPYTQDFESLALLFPYTALPNCWETQTGPDYWDVTNDLTNGPAWLPNIGDHTTGSGNFMWIDASSNITANEMVSPNIDFSLLTDPIAGFWFASDNTTNAINHTIYLDVWDGSAWVNLTDTIGNFADWIRISAPIPPSIPSTTKFRIQAIANPLGTGSDYFYNDLGVDDFFVLPFCAIEEVAPVADLGSLPDITASCEVVSLTDPTATDNCSPVTVSNDATLPIQVASTITWTYTDAVGNFSTQTQNVVFNDLILPTASNPADSSYECEADAVIDGAVVTDAVDNCSATTVTHVGDVVSGNGCQDTITRTYKVTDGSGNFVDVVQMIYIEDVTDPTASNPTSLNVQCIGDVPAPSAGWVTDEADNCAAAPVVAFVSDVSDSLSCPETITRTFSVTDNCGNQTTVDQLIIIMDMTAPIGDIASLPALTGNCDITPSTATATDNCDGAMNGTPDMAFPITAAGTTTVTWTFTDACGNTTAQTQDVVITPVDVTTSMASDGITIVVNNNGQTYQWIDCITGQAIPGETSYNFTPTYGSEFAVIITENGCSDTSACVNSTVGIGEIGIKTLVLYPNPTNGMLTIDFEGEIKNIEVVDMLGRRVKTIVSIENKSVDATELTPGKYMIRITTENDQVLLEEFVLQN